MGSRMMKQVLMKPLVHVEAIQKRHATIDCLMQQGMLQESLGILLKETYDIHRIIARLATDKHNAQDFIRLKQTLFAFSKILCSHIENLYKNIDIDFLIMYNDN